MILTNRTALVEELWIMCKQMAETAATTNRSGRAEFVLVNSASILEKGAVVQKFHAKEHPDRYKVWADVR